MSTTSEASPNIRFILPLTGKVFTEQKDDYLLCKPHLCPLKSVTLEKLEKMQQQAHKQMQETRLKTAAALNQN
jgi:BBSome-interacting protein 1